MEKELERVRPQRVSFLRSINRSNHLLTNFIPSPSAALTLLFKLPILPQFHAAAHTFKVCRALGLLPSLDEATDAVEPGDAD